jgi:hypothetical protein
MMKKCDYERAFLAGMFIYCSIIGSKEEQNRLN